MVTIGITILCTAAWLYVGFWSYVHWTDKMYPGEDWDWSGMKQALKISVLGIFAYFAGQALYNDTKDERSNKQ